MGLKTEILDKIKELFFEYPNKEFTIREIAKKTKIPKSTVQKYLVYLRKEGLITKKNSANIEFFYKIEKITFFMKKIAKSELIDFLVSELNPSCIILFGSIRKSDSNFESDIDLFVESYEEKKLNLEKYEKKLKHKVDLHIRKKIHDLNDNLFNNVVNGIKLQGYFNIK
tara:strand:- start:77 stop:583 length:507 start_codon:yes stop_codon:yes gene_type:complete